MALDLSQKLELYADKKLDFATGEVKLRNDSDGKGTYIENWNVLSVARPDIKALPDYKEQDYIDRFGELFPKSIEEKVAGLETRLAALELAQSMRP